MDKIEDSHKHYMIFYSCSTIETICTAGLIRHTDLPAKFGDTSLIESEKNLNNSLTKKFFFK